MSGRLPPEPLPARAWHALERRRVGTVVFRAVAAPMLRSAFRIRLRGQLPPGGAVLASNHPSYVDGPLALTLHPHVRPIAKPLANPVIRLGFYLSGTILTGAGRFDAAARHLRAGGYIWLAPEGRRSRGSVLGRPRTGAARLAAASGRPIVPLAIIGTAGVQASRWRPWRRLPVEFVAAPPVPVPAGADPAAVSDEVMRTLARMLGLRYAGDVGVLARLRIDALTPADWPRVATIHAAGIAGGDATLETEVPAQADWDAQHLPVPRLAARIDGEVVAWAALSPASRRPAYAGVAEVSVYVDPAWTGRGIGQRLLAALVAASEEQGIWTLQAVVFPENQASLRTHTACGFRVVGVRSRLGRQGDRWRDVVLLERRSGVTGV